METIISGTAAAPPLLRNTSLFSGQNRPAVFLRQPFPTRSGHKGCALAGAASWRVAAKARVRPEMEERASETEKDDDLERAEDGEERVSPEELEKMEAEAMEGRDEGRAPLDYDRRARIFSASSRVFGDVNG